MWSAPCCRSGGLACGCEFDSSSRVKLADERNKQSGATAARVGEPAGLAGARDRSMNHGRNLAQIGSLGTYTEGKGSGHGKVSRCGAGRRAGHRWCGLCHVLRRMRRLSRAGWSWWLRADAGLLCWWAAERGADTGPAGSPSPAPAPSSPSRPAAGAPAGEAAPTPPAPPPASPGRDTGVNAPGGNGAASATPAPTTTVTTSDSAPPVLPSVSPDGGLRVPAANLPSLP